jgi:hypothetical protein
VVVVFCLRAKVGTTNSSCSDCSIISGFVMLTSVDTRESHDCHCSSWACEIQLSSSQFVHSAFFAMRTTMQVMPSAAWLTDFDGLSCPPLDTLVAWPPVHAKSMESSELSASSSCLGMAGQASSRTCASRPLLETPRSTARVNSLIAFSD